MLQCAHAPMGISSRFPRASSPFTNPPSSLSPEGNEKLMKLDLNFFSRAAQLTFPEGQRETFGLNRGHADGWMDGFRLLFTTCGGNKDTWERKEGEHE